MPIEAVVEDENLLALEEGAALDSLDEEAAAAAAVADDASSGKAKKGRGGKKAKAVASASSAGKENAAPKQDAKALRDMGSLEAEALAKEAASKGYGKLYAVFGGGLEGLRACSAGAAPFMVAHVVCALRCAAKSPKACGNHRRAL